MKLKIFIAILVVALVALAVYAAGKRNEFKPAEDFPRGALVYVQVADLPALVKIWNESDFKKKYETSENFNAFKNNHLGLKLASRWEEFNAASGFPIDLQAIGNFADNRAAVALYDVGKMEFVFIAPVSDELFAWTKFAQNQNNFEEETLENGTIIYRAKVKADRGRQKQELIFAHLNGRFVLATSEKLLSQTINNIDGERAKNRLSDEPLFTYLSGRIEPRAATVWVNQTALNDDYYFKRYWLMPNHEKLKNIRAGIFDFSMEDGKFVERRKFLLEENVDSSPIEPAQAFETLSFLPADVPFYRLRRADKTTLDEAVRNTIFDRREREEKPESNRHSYSSSFNDSDESSGGDYDYLSEKFDETIDDADETETVQKPEGEEDVSRFFQAGRVQSILTFTTPKVLPAPLFVRFDRAAIFHLASPNNFNRAAFETAIARRFSEETTISAAGAPLNWETKNENDFTRRELWLPMLGRSACYAVRGGELILTNDAEFLRKILENRNSQTIEKSDAPFIELTVLNLDRKDDAYTSIFAALAEKGAADDFFTGNVASLIESAADVKKIEIRANSSHNVLEQVVTASFR